MAAGMKTKYQPKGYFDELLILLTTDIWDSEYFSCVKWLSVIFVFIL